MKSTFFIVVVVAAFASLASAKPSHAIIAALLRKESGRGLHARSGTIDPSSISKECQPNCTSVLQKLDSCKSASCECTQDNYDKLGVCINCLVALGPLPQYDAPGQDYLDTFMGACGDANIVLNTVDVTAKPTGFSSTGDPLSPFEAPTPTPGETVAVTAIVYPPLIPTFGAGTGQLGSACGINAFWAAGTSTVVAISVTVAVAMGGASFL